MLSARAGGETTFSVYPHGSNRSTGINLSEAMQTEPIFLLSGLPKVWAHYEGSETSKNILST
jgi:hypothetical protein